MEGLAIAIEALGLAIAIEALEISPCDSSVEIVGHTENSNKGEVSVGSKILMYAKVPKNSPNSKAPEVHQSQLFQSCLKCK